MKKTWTNTWQGYIGGLVIHAIYQNNGLCVVGKPNDSFSSDSVYSVARLKCPTKLKDLLSAFFPVSLCGWTFWSHDAVADCIDTGSESVSDAVKFAWSSNAPEIARCRPFVWRESGRTRPNWEIGREREIQARLVSWPSSCLSPAD